MSRGNQDILSERYATSEMNKIFSEKEKIVAERRLWIAVMKAQKELGLNIPSEDITKFEAAIYDIDLDFIERREKETRHDVKAKIEAFVKAAQAHEHLHKGMTSRDLTDNVEQMQIRDASKLVFGKYVSVLRHMLDKAILYKDIYLTARTHHQAAQLTCLGHRFSMWGEELLHHLNSFEYFLENYPLRGIKGPVGTQSDMLVLLKSKEKVDILEEKVAELLGFSNLIESPGQVYFRSLDSELLNHLSSLTDACANFSTGMRLMAGYDLVTEGFKEGQVGSSAMPHKRNTRSSERIWSLAQVIKGYQDTASRIAGSQWEEGDVSCSAARRVFIPGSFYASDGLCETTLTVLNEMGAYPAVINAEIDKYLPFLATTTILALAIQKGIGREQSHKIIRDYSVKEALAMAKLGSSRNTLAISLADDAEFKKAGITPKEIEDILQEREQFIGNARGQIERFSKKSSYLISDHKKEATYEPRPIL